jgi:hypothetical protein
MGLLTGLVILIMQRYMSATAVHQLLTFNPADFFTCAPFALPCWPLPLTCMHASAAGPITKHCLMLCPSMCMHAAHATYQCTYSSLWLLGDQCEAVDIGTMIPNNH